MADPHGAAVTGTSRTCTSRTCTCAKLVILGPPVDQSFMNALTSFSKNWTLDFIRSIAGTMMAPTMLAPVLAFVRKRRAKRELPTAA
jgi:hypothetical protein